MLEQSQSLLKSPKVNQKPTVPKDKLLGQQESVWMVQQKLWELWDGGANEMQGKAATVN